MAVNTDSEVDREVAATKRRFEELKRAHVCLASTFQAMPPKEKARMVHGIESGLKEITAFLQKTKTMEIYNSGTKFGIENIKQNLSTFMTLWKKTLKNLEQGGFVSSRGQGGQTGLPLDQTAQPTGSPAGPASPSEGYPDLSTGSYTESTASTELNAVQAATQAYTQILGKYGRGLNENQKAEFEEKIKTAYTQAQNQLGARKIAIDIIEDAGKIKVKMRPT